MTPLQQRFLDAIEENSMYRDSEIGIEIKFENAAAACEKIADEFAAEFAEWMINNLWKLKFQNESISTKQFIKQFKEQGK